MKKFLPTSKNLSVNKSVNNPRGFTLIELMVVITIIAILAIIALVAYSLIQAQSRDGRRKADIDAMANAMESNRNQVAGTYSNALTDTSIYANGKFPIDPTNSGSYIYSTNNSTTQYVACAYLEKGNGNAASVPALGGTIATGTTYYCRVNQQ